MAAKNDKNCRGHIHIYMHSGTILHTVLAFPLTTNKFLRLFDQQLIIYRLGTGRNFTLR